MQGREGMAGLLKKKKEGMSHGDKEDKEKEGMMNLYNKKK
jgi:hypothetical protein